MVARARPSSSQSASQKASMSAGSAGCMAVVPQQPAFDIDEVTTALVIEAAQSSTRGHYPMAGYEQGIGIGPTRLPDGARRAANLAGNLAIGQQLAKRNGRNGLPNPALKGRALSSQGQIEHRPGGIQPCRNLGRRPRGQGKAPRPGGLGWQEFDTLDLGAVGGHTNGKSRGGDYGRIERLSSIACHPMNLHQAAGPSN